MATTSSAGAAPPSLADPPAPSDPDRAAPSLPPSQSAVPGPGPGAPKPPRFTIRPSSLLKSPVIRKAHAKAQAGAGPQQVRLMHLVAASHRAGRLRTLAKSAERRAEAEAEHCKKTQAELNVLLHAAENGLEWTSLDEKHALGLARAVVDTLEAEEEAVKRKIAEGECLIATLEDAREEAKECAEDASSQVAALLSYFERAGMEVDQAPLTYEPSEAVLLCMASLKERDEDDGIPMSRSDSEDESDFDESGSETDHADAA